MSNNFTGCYGFVIKPDKDTQDQATFLATKFFPQAEFCTKVPHITLYYAKFTNLPIDTVTDILKELQKFNNIELILNKFQIFGDRWLFWNLEKGEEIQSMHQTALKASLFLDKQSAVRAVEEGLTLTDLEKKYVSQFGHPLVMENYLPHISLAYDKEKLTLPLDSESKHWSMKVDEIIFAEIGDYGSVLRTVL